jgi:hypothetical protein
MFRQIKYKNILKAYDLEITGNERYTKTADDATLATTTKTTTKRKASGNQPSSKKITKKVRSDGDGGNVGKDNKGRGDEGHRKKEETDYEVPAKDNSEELKGDEPEAGTA